MKPAAVQESASNADEDLARARRKQAAVLELMRKTGKNGRNIRPMMEDNQMARDAWALGESWRKAQTEP
jgi:hypothetical protein